jgi:hypothetical protein
MSPTPEVPNGTNLKILAEFNNLKFALPYIEDLFTVEFLLISMSWKPLVEYVIR